MKATGESYRNKFIKSQI